MNMKKTYMIPTTDVVKLKIECLLNNASETTTPLHDDETVDDPDDLLSREHDNRNQWDDEDELEDDYGRVSF